MEEGKTGATEELLSVHEKVGYNDKLCITTCLDGAFIPGAVGTVRSIRKWCGKDRVAMLWPSGISIQTQLIFTAPHRDAR
jgi:hypothetical protein